MSLLKRIEQYSSLHGISGDEHAVREAIIEEIAPFCSYEVDAIGNLICHREGTIRPIKKLMISAHMDEVGFVVTYITEDGFLKFSPVGGIDPRVVLGRRVRLSRSGKVGVIGTKAMHQQSAKERGTVVEMDAMFIDIGALSKAEAAEFVRPGDSAVFVTACEEFGDGFLKGKALDDRIGCAILVDMIKVGVKYDTTFVFAVQEEVGLRGAKAAAYTVNPDYAIVVETTTAADFSGVSGEKRVCELGKGTVVGFMDRSTIYDKTLYDYSFELAERKGIAIQTKTMVAGGNDAGAIQTSRGGVRTIAVSVPCRYLHSGVCVVKKDDITATRELVEVLSGNLFDAG